MSKHKKHAKLIKPLGGLYHIIEFGFIGAPCSVIQNLCQQVQRRLATEYSIGFVDANHQASQALDDTYGTIYTDKIDSHQIDTKSVSHFQLRETMAKHDAVFVNGNHFKSDRQIVITNNAKKDSLLRKADRLNNIQLILLDDGLEQPFDFIVKKIDGGQVVPTMSIDNIEEISDFIRNEIIAQIPPVHGLIFMGGQSQRMGKDKSHINYHGQPQFLHLANLLDQHCDTVNLSIGQAEVKSLPYPTINDTFAGLGPYGGLLSAFRENPNAAILTVPCDAPFIDDDLIRFLIEHRNPQKLATCFHNPETNFPEPLITIWEPRAYPILLQFLSMGYSCPRKALINSDIEELQLDKPEKLFNANSVEERDWAMQRLGVEV